MLHLPIIPVAIPSPIPNIAPMKIVRFLNPENQIQYGSLQPDGMTLLLEGDLWSGLRETRAKAEVTKLLAPIAPVSIPCIGLNYRQHAAESKAPIPQWPVLFHKAITAVQNPGDAIEIPTRLASHQVDFECELAVVIGRTCKNVSRADALNHVLGYTCANDVSARDWQKDWGGGQWSRGKTFDTFCPLGPCLVTTDEIPNPNALQIKTIINGEMMQDWNTSDTIFDVPALIEFLSGSTTLLPGTVILTGTPHGVGMARKPPRWLAPGDEVSIEIEKIGTLTNPVKLEA